MIGKNQLRESNLKKKKKIKKKKKSFVKSLHRQLLENKSPVSLMTGPTAKMDGKNPLKEIVILLILISFVYKISPGKFISASDDKKHYSEFGFKSILTTITSSSDEKIRKINSKLLKI